MGGLGPTEIFIIFLIVLVLFGAGRISKLGGELGSGIRAFKEGLQGTDQEKKESPDDKETEAASSDKN